MLDLPVGTRDHTQGPQTALVTLVEYGDYACDRCGQAYTFIQEALQRFAPRLRLVYRHFPAPQRCPRAQRAAEAAEAAGAQGLFWEMHDTLLHHHHELDDGHLVEYADTLGLDTTRFLRDMASHLYADRVREDYASGRRSGAEGTPTFFINGIRQDNACDWEALLKNLDRATTLHV